MRCTIKLLLFVILIIVLRTFYLAIINLFTQEEEFQVIPLLSSPFVRRSNFSDFTWKKFKLIDIEDAEQVVISLKQPTSHPPEHHCNHYNCFDVYRCDPYYNGIKIYLYPIKSYVNSNGEKISGQFSQEFFQLLKEVYTSAFFTHDPSKACLFMPSIDLLNERDLNPKEISQLLASLPFWNGDGQNHIIFNMLPGTSPDFDKYLNVKTGKALIAGGGFDSWSFRELFDIAIPVYSPQSPRNLHRTLEEIKYLIHLKRPQTVVSLQLKLINPKYREILEEMEESNPEKLFLFENCNSEAKATLRCNALRGLKLHYSEILRSSDFCLIMATAFLGSPLLSDALMQGCIPVFVMDDYVLPFQHKIDWTLVSVKIRESNLPFLVDILNAIPPKRIVELREQCIYIWKQYFSSMKAIYKTTIQVITERISIRVIRTKNEWNKPKIAENFNSHYLINSKLTSVSSHGFTAVILTYARFDSLCQVIHAVVKSQSCVKVLVVWNNQEKSPPREEEWPKIGIPLKIIVTKENKLSNRFFPYNEITTDAILAIDDDIVMLTGDELEFGYQVWREYSDLIVGYPSRIHRWDNFTQTWRYESEWTNDLSMVLTGAAFYHKYYNYLYTFKMDQTILKYVDKKKNCEDIAMNFLVSNVTGKAPIKVLPRKKFRCPGCVTADALSRDVANHLKARSACIEKFISIYGHLPLKSVEFRADPVLFKDNLPDKLKKFHRFGNL